MEKNTEATTMISNRVLEQHCLSGLTRLDSDSDIGIASRKLESLNPKP